MEDSDFSMIARIAVGTPYKSSYPTQVLKQLGIACVHIDSIKECVERGVRVIIDDGMADRGVVESAWKQRIAIITHSRSGVHRDPEEVTMPPRSCYFEIPRGAPLSERSFLARLPVVCNEEVCFGTCYDDAGERIPKSGMSIVERSSCVTVILPWNICSYESGRGWNHRPYYCPTVGKHFVEVGPDLDTGAFRRLLLDVLLYCFNWVGLPLIRVSQFYRNRRFFSVRVDADGFSEASTRATLRIAASSGVRFTWFLDMSRWTRKEWIRRLLERNQDVQFHCYRHMTYASQEVNSINIGRGLKRLASLGIVPDAVVSPLGYSYTGFLEAIRRHGFVYSSEFGYGVDDLPSHPRDSHEYPLQIPVHPGCSGVFRMAGFTQEEQFEHLFQHARTQCECDGICILYDHPIGGFEQHEGLFARLLERLMDCGYTYMCMSAYCRMWLGRPSNPRITCEAGRIRVEGLPASGFQLEQITDGVIAPVEWEGELVPQVNVPLRADSLPYPGESLLALMRDLSQRNMKHRHLSRSGWYINEVIETLRLKRGYRASAHMLGRIKWLRAFQERLRA